MYVFVSYWYFRFQMGVLNFNRGIHRAVDLNPHGRIRAQRLVKYIFIILRIKLQNVFDHDLLSLNVEVREFPSRVWM